MENKQSHLDIIHSKFNYVVFDLSQLIQLTTQMNECHQSSNRWEDHGGVAITSVELLMHFCGAQAILTENFEYDFWHSCITLENLTCYLCII
jgi:hypothetical protein